MAELTADDDLYFPRLSRDTLGAIRVRMGASANLGLAPSDPRFLEATTGSIWGDLASPTALENVEFRALLEEYVRAANPSTTFGPHLDGWAESFGLERRDAARSAGVLRWTGNPGVTIQPGTTVTTVAPADGSEAVAFQTVAAITLPAGAAGTQVTADVLATAVEPGSVGNVGPGLVIVPSVMPPGIVSVINPAAMTGGDDIESDARLHVRLLLELAGDHGAGTAADYVRWALAIPGVGSAYVVVAGDGPGTVVLYLLDAANLPVQQPTIDAVQAALDPEPGKAKGKAPVNANLRVTTPASDGVTVNALLVLADGWSIDGANGTRPVRAAVRTALDRFWATLTVGDDVRYAKVLGAVVNASDGIVDVSELLIDGVEDQNRAVASGHVAMLTTLTLRP
jgi:uncharacterized phage protein gp47/JayE